VNNQERLLKQKTEKLLSLLTSAANWTRDSYRTRDGAMNLAAAVFQAETGIPYPVLGSEGLKITMVWKLDSSTLARAIVEAAMRRGLVTCNRTRRINDLAAIDSEVHNFAELHNLLESVA